MTIYYLIFVIAFFLCIFDFVHEKSLYTYIYTLFCIFLISLVSFRRIGIDNDSLTYQNMFFMYAQSSFSDILRGGYGYAERGYVFLNKIISVIGGNFRVLMVVMAILTGFLNYRFLYKNSIYPFISLFTYLSFFYLYRDFTQIRYALSCVLIFWSIKYYLDRNFKCFIIFFILAVLFHNAASIFLITLPFIYIIKNKFFYLLLPIPSLLIGLTYNPFTYLLSKTGLAEGHMSIYLNEGGGGSFSISVLGFILISIYYFMTKKDRQEQNNFHSDFYFKIVALGVSLNLLFIQSSIFQRFSFLLFQFSVLLLPIVIKQIQNKAKNKDFSILFYYAISIFLLLYGIRMINPNLIRPYTLF